MNKRLAILFASFCILVFFGSCQRRYGHVKKVRAGDKTTVQQKPSRFKKPSQQQYFTLENKKPAIAGNLFSDSLFVDETPASFHPGKKVNRKKIRQQNFLAENDSPVTVLTPEDEYAPHPDIEDVKLGNSNFNEVANVSLIVGLVLLLLLLLFLLGSFAVSGFIAFAAAEDIFLAVLGVGLIFPIIWLINRLYKDLQDDRVRYGGKDYPLEDIKRMPGQVRLKRAWHNFIASILLTALGSVLFFFGLIFLPGVVWYFFKLLHALFFIERY